MGQDSRHTIGIYQRHVLPRDLRLLVQRYLRERPSVRCRLVNSLGYRRRAAVPWRHSRQSCIARLPRGVISAECGAVSTHCGPCRRITRVRRRALYIYPEMFPLFVLGSLYVLRWRATRRHRCSEFMSLPSCWPVEVTRGARRGASVVVLRTRSFLLRVWAVCS